jgi:hypothetical protein
MTPKAAMDGQMVKILSFESFEKISVNLKVTVKNS